MSPANCFSLLQLGRRQGLHHVEARALRAALSCFPQAVRLDRAGFESLPEEVGRALNLPQPQLDNLLSLAYAMQKLSSVVQHRMSCCMHGYS